MAALPGRRPDPRRLGGLRGDAAATTATCSAPPRPRAFSARVRDVHEWLAERVDALRPPSAAPAPDAAARPVVAVQDPCHLRHVQRAHLAVRTVLSPFATLVELDDEGLCCGAGGAYAAAQPELAGAIRDRKVAAIARSGAPLVASANPGCALHLAAAGRRRGPPVHDRRRRPDPGRPRPATLTVVARRVSGAGPVPVRDPGTRAGPRW